MRPLAVVCTVTIATTIALSGCSALTGLASLEKDDCAAPGSCEGGAGEGAAGDDGALDADGRGGDGTAGEAGPDAGDAGTDGSDSGGDAGDGGADAGDGTTETDAPPDTSGDSSLTCNPPTPTNCGGVCVNTTSDGPNCGACGHDCLGGQCVASTCQPVTLASGLTDAMGVAVDATNVYFTEGSAGIVGKAPLTATGVITQLATGQGTTIGVAVDTSGNVYFAVDSSSSGGIMKVPAGTTTPSSFASVSSAYWLVTDGSHLYWTSNSGNGTVWQVSVGGGSPTPIATGQSWPTDIAMTTTNVYWGTEQNGDGIWSYTIASGTSTQIVTSQNNARAVAADSNNVYWGDDTAPGTVSQQPLGGGTPTTLGANESIPYSIVADSTRGYVYWTDNGGNKVMRAKIGVAGSGALLWSDSAPRQITQDANAIYWTSKGNGKVMMLAK